MRRLGPSEWEEWRAIRLRAPAEDPEAFGSTLEGESTNTRSRGVRVAARGVD